MTPEEKEFAKKLDSFANDTTENQSTWKRLIGSIRHPNDAQKLGRRAFSSEFFSLLLRTVSPFAASHRATLLGTFGMSQLTSTVDNIKNNLNRASNINIYNKTIGSLIDDVSTTMPEIEREMKSRVLEKNMNSIGNATIDFIHSKFRKYSSYLGVAGSTVAIASLNPWLLALGLPAYMMERRLCAKQRELQKTVFPHEFHARQAVWNQQDKSARNPAVHFITADRKQQSEELKKAQKDLFEVSEFRRKKQLPLIYLSAGVTTALTGIALAAGWGSMTLPALVGTYAATNAFLGSIQSWVMTDYNQQEILRDVMKHYDEIRHTPDFDLQVGKEKLPHHVDTVHIDRIKYNRRKTSIKEAGKRQEKATLDFSTDFYFKPGINILGGISGAGKTTLYKLMRHADDVGRGSISVGTMEKGKFEGKKLTDLSLEDANKSIAFSLPELEHVDDLKAIELIKAANPKISQDSLKEIAKLFSIPLWEDEKCTQEKYISNMSSGEKKRVLCVSALVSPKKILVLDEPTSGLDPMNVDRILDAINVLGKDKTIIYTTHHPEELLKLNVSNIVDLDQKKTKDGEVLPTDVKVYPCKTEEDKKRYIQFCRRREPLKVHKKSIRDILDANVCPPSEEKAHKNVFLKRLLTAVGTSRAAHLHEIVSKNPTTKKTTIDQKIVNQVAKLAMKKRANPARHKRLYKALHEAE